MANSIIEFGLTSGSWQMRFDQPSWDFPAIYELGLGTQPAELVRFIAQGGDSQDLSLGENVVRLNGSPLSFVWKMGQASAIKVGFNPINQAGSSDGFPQKVIASTRSSEPNEVQFVDGPQRTYHLHGKIERQSGEEEAQVVLFVNGGRDQVLSDSFHVDRTASSLSFAFEGLTGSGQVKVEFEVQPFP